MSAPFRKPFLMPFLFGGLVEIRLTGVLRDASDVCGPASRPCALIPLSAFMERSDGSSQRPRVGIWAALVRPQSEVILCG